MKNVHILESVMVPAVIFGFSVILFYANQEKQSEEEPDSNDDLTRFGFESGMIVSLVPSKGMGAHKHHTGKVEIEHDKIRITRLIRGKLWSIDLNFGDKMSRFDQLTRNGYWFIDYDQNVVWLRYQNANVKIEKLVIPTGGDK